MKNTRQELVESIKKLGLESFRGAAYAHIYLDPKEPEVYLFRHVGPGLPMAAHDGRHPMLGQARECVAESVVSELLAHVDTLVELVEDYYQGSHWDGSRYRGQWQEDAEALVASLDLAFEQYIDATDVYLDESWQDLKESRAYDHLGIDWEQPTSEQMARLAVELDTATRLDHGYHAQGTVDLLWSFYDDYVDEQQSVA